MGNMTHQNDESVVNTSAEKQVQHKWPIRPGVHVHVNGLHTLNNSGNAPTSGGAGPTMVPAEKITGFSYGARNSNSGSGSSAGSTANCDDISNAGSSTTGHDDIVPSTATLNINHKEVMARGTSTERNQPSVSVASNTINLPDINPNSSNLSSQNTSNIDTKPMQGRF